MLGLASMLVDQPEHAKAGEARYQEAESWALQAAKSGHGAAMLWLGSFYLTATKDAPIYHKAEIWLQQAASNNAQNAHISLARFYADDSSPLFEPTRAHHHFKIAIMLEEPQACLARASYYKRRPEAQDGYDIATLISDLECAAKQGSADVIS